MTGFAQIGDGVYQPRHLEWDRYLPEDTFRAKMAAARLIVSHAGIGNLLTSDPVRYARNIAVLEAEPALAIGSPTVGWADAAFRAMSEISDERFPASIRQPILILAAGMDAIVSTPAIGEFALRLRAGSHLVVPGARHELLMEQDRFRIQTLAAFDAFVPGTPLFK